VFFVQIKPLLTKSLALVGAACFLPLAAFAVEKSSFKMAFVDMQSAILQTEEGKAARAKIEKDAGEKRKDLLNQQNELKKMDEDFQAQMSVLTDEAKMTKQKEFQSKFQALRNAQMTFEQDVRQKELQETQKIFQNMSHVIEDISKKKAYDAVFERGSGALLYAAHIDDITAEVVSLYNSRHKSKAKTSSKPAKTLNPAKDNKALPNAEVAPEADVPSNLTTATKEPSKTQE